MNSRSAKLVIFRLKLEKVLAALVKRKLERFYRGNWSLFLERLASNAMNSSLVGGLKSCMNLPAARGMAVFFNKYIFLQLNFWPT